MRFRGVFGFVLAATLFLGARAASADLIDVVRTSHTVNPDGSGTASYDFSLDSGGIEVGAFEVFYDYDNAAQVVSTTFLSCINYGTGVLGVCHFNVGWTFVDASYIGGANADVWIGGWESGTPVPHNTLVGTLTVDWAPGTSWLNLVMVTAPMSAVYDEFTVPIPGAIPTVIRIVPEPGPLVLLGMGLGALGLLRRRPA